MDWLLKQQTLFILQTISSIMMTVLVLMQSKGTGLSTAFGGDGSFYHSKRGAEKLIYRMTIFFAVAFVFLSFLTLYAK